MSTTVHSDKHHTENTCSNVTAAGRQCRLPRAADHDSLCQYHAQLRLREHLQKTKAAEVLAADLLGPVKGFRSAAAINLALGRLLMLSVRDRIAPRQAGVLAYICQLLMTSLPQVKKESWDNRGTPGVEKILDSGEQIPVPAYRR